MRKMKDSGIAWIGEIPDDWSIVPLFGVFKEHKEKNIENREKNVLSLSYGKIIRRNVETNMGLLPESFSTYNIVKSGDIVLRLTDLQNDKRSLRTGLVTEQGIITSAYLTLRSIKDFSYRFNHYLLHCYDLIKVLYNMGDGVRQNLKFSELSHLPFLAPSISEQQRIAEYLDTQCAKIDSTIAKTQQIIDKLKAYKQSVITEAVTKGLNPDAPMKDSGIEWIGEIPEHWRIAPLTKQLESIVDYRGKTPEKVDEGIFLITAKNIKNGKINYEISQEYIRPEEYEEIMRRGKPAIGDVLFTTEAPLGEVANIDNENIALAQRVIKFRPLSSLNSFFLKYWIMGQGFQQFLTTLSTGSTATGIKASKLFAFRIADAPLQEQQEIVSYLDDKCVKIDGYIAKKQEVIEKLTAYKKSLIFEVVTGKKEI